MAAQARQRPLGAMSRMGIVAGMHAALLFVMAQGMGVVPKFSLPPIITGTVIQETRPDIDPVPIPDYVPRNDFSIDLEQPELPPVADDSPPPDRVPTPATQTGTGTGSGSALPVPLIVGPRVDARHPLTRPAYPADMIRANQEGAVELEVFVLPSGRVGDARILKSSGFASFDRAALQEARRAWRLQPATRDGVPYAQWYALRIVFDLEDLR